MKSEVITAAWVQAAPVWVAGVVALVTLGNWKKQQRGQRKLEHAERALASGREMFSLIKLISHDTQVIIRDDHGDWGDVTEEVRNISRLRRKNIDSAWSSWQPFQAYYTLSVFYSTNIFFNVSQESAEILTQIKSLKRILIKKDEPPLKAFPNPDGTPRLRHSMTVKYKIEEVNNIAERVARAELALIEQLSPILSPLSTKARLTQKASKIIARAKTRWRKNKESR